MSLIIIADDLTGAADSAARCHTAGLPATILLNPPTAPLPPGAVAFSTDSRFLPPAAAAERVGQTVQQIDAPAATWYKKIDSTLRGNPGAELEAMLTWRETQGEQPLAVICPAFPAQGRGLAAGALRFAQSPGQGLHLPTILGAQTALPLVAIGLERVRAGVEALADQLQQAVRQGANLVVVDGLADADLATLLAATGLATPGALLCGSAGLIEPLARRLAATGDYPPPLPAEPLRPPLLAVVGSGSEMSHRQLAALRAEGQIPLVELGDWAAEQSLLRQQQGALDGLVLHLPPPLPEAALEGEAARRLAVALARTATQVCADLQPGGLLVVGGDTAIHLLNELGIAQLTVVRELMPGIPLLTGVDRRGRRRQLITKAGNFGEETTLVRLFQKVQWKSTSEAGGR